MFVFGWGLPKEFNIKTIQKLYNGMGWVSEWSGKTVSGLIIVLVIAIAYDVTARYIFNAPTIWSFSVSYMLGGTFAALGLCYVYYYNGNVRVDIIYSRLSPKGKLIIDILFTVIFFFPLFFTLAKLFIQDALFSYSTHEVGFESVLYPVLWPFKTLLALGFSLLFLQGVATFVKDVAALVKGGREPW